MSIQRQHQDGEEVLEEIEVKSIGKLLLKYFHPLDAEGYRKCKLCETIPHDQKRSAGSTGKVKAGRSKYFNFMRHIERIHKIQYVAFQKERDQLTEEQARRKQAEGKLGKQYFKRIAAQDGELGMKMKGTHKVLAKYFHPLDDEGYRQCKLCEQIPQDQRRSQGKVKVGRSRYFNFVRHIKRLHEVQYEDFQREHEQLTKGQAQRKQGCTEQGKPILDHLKTHGIKKGDQWAGDEAEQLPPERFNRLSTLFVLSDVTSKSPPAKATMEMLCRLCARQSTSLQPIFSMYNGRLLNDIISNLCPIKIDVSDSLPQKVCDECLEIVVSANRLRETSLLSDINFRSGNFNLPERTIQIKEEHQDDELEFDYEQMIDYPMSNSSQTFPNDSAWDFNDWNPQQQWKRKQTSFKLRKNCADKRKSMGGTSKSIESQAHRLDIPLNEALREASVSSEKTFDCDFCAEKFTQKTSIEQHMNSKHFENQQITQPLRFSCPLDCGAIFLHHRSIKRHIRNLHKDNLECNKTFSEKNCLKHERMTLNTCVPAPSIS